MIEYRTNFSCMVDVAAWVSDVRPKVFETILGRDGSPSGYTCGEIVMAFMALNRVAYLFDFDNPELDKKTIFKWAKNAIVCYDQHAIGIKDHIISTGEPLDHVIDRCLELIIV